MTSGALQTVGFRRSSPHPPTPSTTPSSADTGASRLRAAAAHAKRAATLGDSAWKKLIEAHDERAKSQVADHHGVYVMGTGEGTSGDDVRGIAREIRIILDFLSRNVPTV